MALYLVQHGKCLSKEVDPRKSLSTEGIADVKRIAEVANGYKVQVSAVVHSGKLRARQTAEIFGEILQPEQGITAREGLNPLDDVVAFADIIDAQANAMFVGHLPFMERLTSYLLTGSTDKPIFKFQNGGIICLDMEADHPAWIIRWTLMPEIK
jgi:phosphohistidine phosphatase